MRSIVAVLALLIAAVAPMRHQTGSPPKPERRQDLLGNWNLVKVGGKDPKTILIKSWRAEFLEQGTWNYSGAMTGTYEGMKFSGSGAWVLRGTQLDYTAGANNGTSTVRIDGNSLILSPDPVIRLHGKENVDTEYARATSP